MKVKELIEQLQKWNVNKKMQVWADMKNFFKISIFIFLRTNLFVEEK